MEIKLSQCFFRVIPATPKVDVSYCFILQQGVNSVIRTWGWLGHGSSVEALQVDTDLVTYGAAVGSCEKAVRWKLALFLGMDGFCSGKCHLEMDDFGGTPRFWKPPYG